MNAVNRVQGGDCSRGREGPRETRRTNMSGRVTAAGYVRVTEGLEYQPKGSELVPSKPHRALEGS